MSTLFSQRHQGYKVGLGLALVSFIVFLVGFAAPNWIRVTIGVTSGHTGIWQSCGSGGSVVTVCFGLAGHYSPGWLKAVQALECLALIGFLVLGFYAIIANFLKEHRTFTRIIEIGIGLSAGAGLIGVIVYGVEIKNAQSAVSESLLSIYSYDSRLSWAFYLTIVGCVLALVSAVVISVFNKPLPPAANLPVTFHTQPLSGVPVGAPHAPVMVNYPVSAGYVNAAYPAHAGYPASVPYVAVNPGHPPPYYFVPQGQAGIVAPPAQGQMAPPAQGQMAPPAQGQMAPPAQGQMAPPAGATAPYAQAPVVSDYNLPQTKQ